jgi:hypothetical protein
MACVLSGVEGPSALLERTPEAEELLGVLTQLLGHECAKVDARIVRDRSGRHSDDRQAGEENGSAY